MIEPSKPLLRGWSHQIASIFALIAGILLIRGVSHPVGKWATLVYVVSLVGLLGTSALYHRVQWSEVARKRMRRLDHAAIFVLIAGTYTPIAMTLSPDDSHRLLWFAWVGAALGALRAIFWIGAPKGLVALLAVAMGWFVIGYMPAIDASAGRSVTWLIAVGGALYSAGALIYAVRRPDPWPRVFGYHEIFHALVVLAAGAHFAAVALSMGALHA